MRTLAHLRRSSVWAGLRSGVSIAWRAVHHSWLGAAFAAWQRGPVAAARHLSVSADTGFKGLFISCSAL